MPRKTSGESSIRKKEIMISRMFTTEVSGNLWRNRNTPTLSPINKQL